MELGEIMNPISTIGEKSYRSCDGRFPRAAEVFYGIPSDALNLRRGCGDIPIGRISNTLALERLICRKPLVSLHRLPHRQFHRRNPKVTHLFQSPYFPESACSFP